ncbi:hypothetical protein DNTS_020264, partial [Danionella cerebrum]
LTVGSDGSMKRVLPHRKQNLLQVMASGRSLRQGEDPPPPPSSSTSSSPPGAGDTLPWNRPKHHHRVRRSRSASGDVMDPAERAVIRIAGLCYKIITLSQNVTWKFCLQKYLNNN